MSFYDELPRVRELEGIRPDNLTDEILNSEYPIVLKGFCSQWPLVELAQSEDKKAMDYLLKFYQGMPVAAGYGESENKGRIFYDEHVKGFNFKAGNVELNKVFDSILSHCEDAAPPTLYVGSTPVDNLFPGFRELHLVDLGTRNALVNIWMGNNSRIAAHYDFPTNLACCLLGKRRFTLFPPEELENLYIGPLEISPGGQEISMVDFANPDYAKFPKFKQALMAAQTANLDNGDALFLPGMWWHHVEAFGTFNVLMTHWWRPSPVYTGRPMNALQLGIMSIRNLPPEQRKAWQNAFNYYVFEQDKHDQSHIPEHALGMLKQPFDELSARKLRADLLNKLKR